MEEEKEVIELFKEDLEEVMDYLSPEEKEKILEEKQKVIELYNKVDELSKQIDVMLQADERNFALLVRPTFVLIFRTLSFSRSITKLKRKWYQRKISPEKYAMKVIKIYTKFFQKVYKTLSKTFPQFSSPSPGEEEEKDLNQEGKEESS